MAKRKHEKKLDFVFDKKIYSTAAVKKAVEDYSPAAGFKISDNKNAVRVTISDMPPGREDELGGEFCNYTLYLMKAM